MLTNRVAAFRQAPVRVRDHASQGQAGLYERIGRAVSRFIEARRRGEDVSPEHYVLQFPGPEREQARRCFETAELLLSLGGL